MARYLIKYRNYAGKILDQPAVQKILVNGGRLGAWMLSVPSVALSSEDRIDAGVLVFERSLIWLRQRFPHVPMTLVYIPSTAAIYRHAGDEVISHDIYVPSANVSQNGEETLIDGTVFPVVAVYANSQKICEKIREVSIAQGIRFIDTRPTLRAAASATPLHGPRDWNHLNESGYRALGTPAPDNCDNRWDVPKGAGVLPEKLYPRVMTAPVSRPALFLPAGGLPGGRERPDPSVNARNAACRLSASGSGEAKLARKQIDIRTFVYHVA
jgi:hypothetical protein